MPLARCVKADERQRPDVSVQTKRDDDRVDVTHRGDKTVALIRSPYGISRAVITRKTEQWPACLVLKLQLKGLEHLKLENGKTTLEAAVGARDGKLSVRLWRDRAEDAPLDSSNPYWIKTRMLGSDGKPTYELPLKDGLFELMLPAAFFADNPKSITVEWIDFYRG